MPGRLFLVAAMLSCCAGDVQKVSAPVKILTFTGQTVILPCHINVSNGDFPTVEWFHISADQKIALVYRQGCETFAEKDPAFHFRTNLFMNELKNGNISLRLSNVQLSDAGTFICKMIWSAPQEIVRIELVVAAVSEPKLSMVLDAGDDVTLQCEASCLSPQPEITFVDAQGQSIIAEDPQIDEDSRTRCFTATRRATVRTANRVTCRVHLPEINETRHKEIHVPDGCFKRTEREGTSCTALIIIAVLLTTVVTGSISCALTSLLWKKYGDSVGRRKMRLSQSSQQSSTRSNADGHNTRNQADPTGNATTEHLRRISELESSLRDKEEIIRQLTEELKDLRSKRGPVVCQHDQPTIDKNPSKSSPDVSKPTNLLPDQFPHNNNPKPAALISSENPKSVNLPQNKDSKPGVAMRIPASGLPIQRGSHRHSSPALLTHGSATLPSASSALPSEETHVVRSMSMSESRPRQNSSKIQRRYTTSAMSYNRFKVLANLPEDDSEPLL